MGYTYAYAYAKLWGLIDVPPIVRAYMYVKFVCLYNRNASRRKKKARAGFKKGYGDEADR